MKFAATLKSAVLFSVLIIGIEGAAFAGKPGTNTGAATSQSHTTATGRPMGKRQHKPVSMARGGGRSSPHMPTSVSAGQPGPQRVGRLLPAVQSAREATR